MDGPLERLNEGDEEIISLNVDDLDVAELERRLEMAVMIPLSCIVFKDCTCPCLSSCGTYCNGQS